MQFFIINVIILINLWKIQLKLLGNSSLSKEIFNTVKYFDLYQEVLSSCVPDSQTQNFSKSCMEIIFCFFIKGLSLECALGLHNLNLILQEYLFAQFNQSKAMYLSDCFAPFTESYFMALNQVLMAFLNIKTITSETRLIMAFLFGPWELLRE